MLKILGGQAKNLTLSVPKSNQVRPTSVLLRRKIFDSYQNINEYYFIDCCCGSGAMGIEALSRGAMGAIFVEKNKKIFQNLLKNIEALKARMELPELELKNLSSDIWIKNFKKEYEAWDETKKTSTLLFFDPPYEDKKTYEVIFNELSSKWFRGLLMIESDTQKGPALETINEAFGPSDKIFTHGTSFVYTLRCD